MDFWPLNAGSAGYVSTQVAVAIMQSVGSGHFAQALLRSVQQCLPSSYCSIFRVSCNVTSVLDVAGNDSQHSGTRQARTYLESKFYAEDPIWRERCDAETQGLLAVRNASDIPSDVYRSMCYETIGLAQRSSLVFPVDASGRVALNFYSRECLSASELDVLRAFSPLLATALQQHLALGAEVTPTLRTRAFLSKFNLTPREEQVLLFALQGLTNKEIAKQLDLQPSTVVSYRDRAYLRLGISRHADLVKMLLIPDLGLGTPHAPVSATRM